MPWFSQRFMRALLLVPSLLVRLIDIDRNEKGIDIHHIFPRKWCEDNGIGPRVFNSIVNKTAISYKANRKIGGKAPSAYLEQLQNEKAVQLQPAAMDAILETHCISPSFLRTDDFTGFFQDRKATLLNLVELAMGKQAIATSDPVGEDDMEAEDESLSEAESTILP